MAGMDRATAQLGMAAISDVSGNPMPKEGFGAAEAMPAKLLACFLTVR